MASVSQNLVVCNPDILGGKAVFVGTRVPVESLFAHLKAGDTIETFLEDFPTVTRKQAESVLTMAVEHLSSKPST